jgi:hypothetical protein
MRYVLWCVLFICKSNNYWELWKRLVEVILTKMGHKKTFKVLFNTDIPFQMLSKFFTFDCCILLCIYLTDSLWRRQSQQSFNILTPFNFLFFYSLHVSAPTGHPQVRYTISYYFYFWRTILIQWIRCTYVIWLLYLGMLFCRHRFFNLSH